MKNDDIIREVKRLFGSRRTPLLKLIHSCAEKFPVRKVIEDRLRTDTGCHVRSFNGLSEETSEWLSKDPGGIEDLQFDPEDREVGVGDTSFQFLIVLNPDIPDPLDFDDKLAERYGRLLLCEVWASFLFPLYSFDTYYWDYSKENNAQEWGPHKPESEHEIAAVKAMKKVMKDFGYKAISKQVAKTWVESAITDTLWKGDATVFDCLFTDMAWYREIVYRTNIDFQEYPELGLRGGWRETYKKNGQLREKELYLSFLGNDNMGIKFDGNGTITKFEINSRPHGKIDYQWIAYDTSENTGYLLRKHRKYFSTTWF